jgi:hypothetical protein
LFLPRFSFFISSFIFYFPMFPMFFFPFFLVGFVRSIEGTIVNRYMAWREEFNA